MKWLVEEMGRRKAKGESLREFGTKNQHCLPWRLPRCRAPLRAGPRLRPPRLLQRWRRWCVREGEGRNRECVATVPLDFAMADRDGRLVDLWVRQDTNADTEATDQGGIEEYYKHKIETLKVRRGGPGREGTARVPRGWAVAVANSAVQAALSCLGGPCRLLQLCSPLYGGAGGLWCRPGRRLVARCGCREPATRRPAR